MTHVSTPQTGTYPGGRSWNTRSMVGALALTLGLAAAMAIGFVISQQNDAPASPPSIVQAHEAEALKEAIAKGFVPSQALEPAQNKLAQESEALEEAIAKGFVPSQTREPTESAQESEALRDAIAKGFVPEQTQSSAYTEQLGQPR